MDWVKQLRDETRNIYVLGLGDYIRELTVVGLPVLGFNDIINQSSLPVKKKQSMFSAQLQLSKEVPSNLHY